jgi:hypothetical protein
VVNVSGPRYGAIHTTTRQVIGFNNIELITDRPLQVNLDEIRRINGETDREWVALRDSEFLRRLPDEPLGWTEPS